MRERSGFDSLSHRVTHVPVVELIETTGTLQRFRTSEVA